MIKIKEFINRIKLFFAENPKRARLIGLIAIVTILPLIVIAALTIQNLQQKASELDVIRITDASGNTLTTTATPDVYIALQLPPGWVLPSQPSASKGLIPQAYAIAGQQCDNLGGNDCSTNEQCVFDDPACISGCEGVCKLKQESPTPIPTTPISTTSAPTSNILRAIYIENKDTDGSTGGDSPKKTYVSTISEIAHIAWRLNGLLPGQTQTPRIVQVTLIGDNQAVPFASAINLVLPNGPTNILSRVDVSFDCVQVSIGRECHGSALAYDTANAPMYKDIVYSWGISSSNSIGTLDKTNGNITNFYAQNIGTASIWVLAQQNSIQIQKSFDIQVVNKLFPYSTPTFSSFDNRSFDLNKDGVINCKDTKILMSQYGEKGLNLSADVNNGDNENIVNGVDYNTLFRNYTPGDTTVCPL